MSETTDRRDDAVWNLLDRVSGLTAREVAETLEISKALVHQSLNRLEADGRVRRSDGAVFPLAWAIVEPPTDAKVELTRSDARFVVHMLGAMLREGRAGQPTVDLIARIEEAIGE